MDIVTALKVVRPYLAGLAALGLLAGIIAKVAGRDAGAAAVWAAATLPVLLALLVEIVTSLRRGDVGLDIVAGAIDESRRWSSARTWRRRSWR